MGRPLNKRYFGSGTGNQIKVRAKIGANTEGDGVIVSQRGSKKFKVTVGSNTGDCFLVDKANGALGANEMTITVITDAGTAVRATKISAHRVSTTAGTSFAWTFTPSEEDNKVQVVEEAGPTITITAQPGDLEVIGGDPATFSVNITGVAESSVTYAWEFLEPGGDWESAVTAWATGATTATLTIPDTSVNLGTAAYDLNGYQFRVVVSATGATSVTSDVATLTASAT